MLQSLRARLAFLFAGTLVLATVIASCNGVPGRPSVMSRRFASPSM